MDIILIVGAIILFLRDYFNEGVMTPQQKEWERELIETNKNMEKIRQATYERFHNNR